MSTNPVSAQGPTGIVGLFTVRDAEIARKACDLVATFRPRLHMADSWYKTLGRLHRLFLRTKKELRRNYKFQLFSASEPYQGRSALHPLRMGAETYKSLDAVFGRDPSPQPEDSEMADAPESGIKDENSLQATEGALRESWAAVNAIASSHTQVTPTSNGYGSSYQASPQTSTSQYPPISPPAGDNQPYTPSSTSGFPQNVYGTPFQQRSPGQGEPAQQETPSVPPKVPSQPWTHEQVEAWLNSLETVFGANDVAAFVEAVDWKDFGAPSSPVKGWLRLAWLS